MLYTKMTKAAMKICFEAHKNQLDKSGLPYVFHPFHLAEQMTDEESTVTALLHDVMEDSSITAEKLAEAGICKRCVEAISLLTHDKSLPYMIYVAKIKQNPIARAVKLADLKHNSDLSRLDNPTERDILRREKYLEAIKLLESAD